MNVMFQIDVNLKGLFKTDEGGKGREEGKKRQKAHIKNIYLNPTKQES